MEPADDFAEAERAQFLDAANDRSGTAKPFALSRLDWRAGGRRRQSHERLTVLMDACSHFMLPAERFLHFAPCRLIGFGNTDPAEDVHLRNLAIDGIT